jgi:hypothetical protein
VLSLDAEASSPESCKKATESINELWASSICRQAFYSSYNGLDRDLLRRESRTSLIRSDVFTVTYNKINDIPEIKDNCVRYKADHDGSNDEGISSVIVGYIRNGIRRPLLLLSLYGRYRSTSSI